MSVYGPTTTANIRARQYCFQITYRALVITRAVTTFITQPDEDRSRYSYLNDNALFCSHVHTLRFWRYSTVQVSFLRPFSLHYCHYDPFTPWTIETFLLSKRQCLVGLAVSNSFLSWQNSKSIKLRKSEVLRVPLVYFLKSGIRTCHSGSCHVFYTYRLST